VEGITDRRYIAHWLKMHQVHLNQSDPKARLYKEDLHYSFVECGGGNITHFSFLDDDEVETSDKRIQVERLCAKLFLITDKDSGKDERQAKLKAKLGDRCHCLEGREIENLLKPEVIQACP
jgi:hypothetical protein